MPLSESTHKFLLFTNRLPADTNISELDQFNFNELFKASIGDIFYTGKEVVESFENIAENGSVEFISSGNRCFYLSGGLEVVNGEGLGAPTDSPGTSDWYLSNISNAGAPNPKLGLKITDGSKIKVGYMKVFPSDTLNLDPYQGQISVTLKLNGSEVYNKTYDVESSLPSDENGFDKVDLYLDYFGFCDEVEIDLLGDMIALSIDEFNYTK